MKPTRFVKKSTLIVRGGILQALLFVLLFLITSTETTHFARNKWTALRLHTEDNEVCRSLGLGPWTIAYIARIRSRVGRVTRVYCERVIMLVLRHWIAWIALCHCPTTQKCTFVTSWPTQLVTGQVRDTSESCRWTRHTDDVAWSTREFANTRWNTRTNRMSEQLTFRYSHFRGETETGNWLHLWVTKPTTIKRNKTHTRKK